MEPTDLTLIITAGLATAATLVGLGFTWRRLTGYRWTLRVVGIVATEALLALTVALVINRLGDFYPTWSDLAAPPGASSAPGPAQLREQLRIDLPHSGKDGLVFRWPGSAATTEQPMLWLPPAYFKQPQSIEPVVLVLAPAGAGPSSGAWNADDIGPVASGATGCVVFLRLAPHTDPAGVLNQLAPQLVAKLGVADHGWGVVAVGTALPAGRALAAGAFDRISVISPAPAGPGNLGLRTALTRTFALIPPPLLPPLVLPTAPPAPPGPASSAPPGRAPGPSASAGHTAGSAVA